MRKTRLSLKASNGFSIVELLIVIMVLGILISLAGLGVRRYQRSVEADATATQLSQAIRLLRDQAITERATFRLILKKDSSKPGDLYIIEKWTYNPLTGAGTAGPQQVNQLPKGWRFGKSDASVPNPRGLVDVLGAATETNLLFKGDGSIRSGNTTALIANPTLEVGANPLNGSIFIYDTQEPDTAVQKYKPRSITLLGATGRTAVWKLFPSGSTFEWRSGTQVS